MSVDVMPTEEDLRINQTEMARYCCSSSGKEEGGEEEDVESPLFVLMNASIMNFQMCSRPMMMVSMIS